MTAKYAVLNEGKFCILDIERETYCWFNTERRLAGVNPHIYPFPKKTNQGTSVTSSHHKSRSNIARHTPILSFPGPNRFILTPRPPI